MRGLFLGLGLAVVAGPAIAGLEFCNQTSASASVAVGYHTEQGWTSEGWWNLEGGECQVVIGGDLTETHYYWRAESRELSWTHAKFMFCTVDEAFTIVGDDECGPRGYEREGFNEIEVGDNTHFTMNLTNSAEAEDSIADHGPGEGDAPMGAGDPPGTHGEPYTITGLLSHCEWYDAGMGCIVIADGFSYVASSYDPTPLALLEYLETLGPNVPVTVSGDMISSDGTEAMVTIREWEIASADLYAGERSLMQGFWQSDDDASYELLIHGSSFEEYSQQIPSGLLYMHFQEGCPGYPGDGPAFQLVSRLGDEDRCMFLSYVDGNSLELFPAGVMRPLFFTKRN